MNFMPEAISLYLLQAPSEFLDAGGQCGSIVHYFFILGFVGGAFLIFLYLWKKNRLDMDEEPKLTMMKEDDDEEEDSRGGA
jgi:hypothetical protein